MSTKIRFVLGTVLLATATGSAAMGQSFSYPDFSDMTGLVLNGHAAQEGVMLRLTPAAGNQKATVFYHQPLRVSTGFEVLFRFQLTQLNCGGADGMTFIIHNDSRGTAYMGDGGGELAYGAVASASGTGALNSLVIEFDTYKNGADLSSNEISVHTNGTAENDTEESLSIGSVDATVSMKDGAEHTVLISYSPGQLEIFIDDMVNPELSVPYDFATGGTWLGGGAVGGLNLIGGSDAYIGLTAATGGCWENHDILSWDFVQKAPGIGYCTGDIGSGTPCPCANENDGTVPGAGCANGVFSTGALLGGTGVATVSPDTVVLFAAGVEPSGTCLFFQADNDLAPGLIWGDGLRCAGGALKRLGTEVADAAGYSDTSLWGTPISLKAGNVGAGGTKYYQCWYANTIGSMCGSGINTTNGFAITWSP